MNIGANIRRLRIEKELTQDKLAGMIGITPQAVSKWERDEGLPDITLLPAIAAALDCSTDELLGIGHELTDEELVEIIRKATDLIFGDRSEEALKNPDPDAGVEYLRTQLEKYPKEWRIRENLASFLGLSLKLGGYDEDKRRELMEHYEYIRLNAPDISARLQGVVGIVRAYADAGEYEKAEEAAKELAIPYQTYAAQAVKFLRGDRLREFLRGEIISGMLKLRDSVYCLTSGVFDPVIGKRDKSHAGSLDQQLELVELAVKALEAMRSTGWGSDWGVFTAMELWHGAELAMESGEPETALDYIERSLEYCRPVPGEEPECVVRPDPEKKDPNFTEKIIPSARIRENVHAMINAAENSSGFTFAPLITHPRWKALKEKLQNM